MDPDLPELEQEFRQSWREYSPVRYSDFLERTDESSRVELLARMLSAELEFFFQPPTQVIHRVAANHQASVDDDERVRPCVQLFALRFPEIRKHPEQILRLIVLEYALRLRHDRTPPDPDSYFDLCQDFSSRLAGLLELTESKIHGVRSEHSSPYPPDKSGSTVRETEPTASIAVSPLPYNLGCFLLTRMIGRGGMGYVHAAIDLRSTAQVAVKVMRRIDAWSVYRFIEEFSWLSQLSHPNLVRLYDAFSDGDVRYFSMELVEGKTIGDWFRRLPLSKESRWNSLRKVLAQLASAIQFLHQRGVIHRDIKCSNVMITPRRRAVLLDLGLAIRHNEASVAPSQIDGERLIGTLQYMAPEGLCGAPLDQASDWYSFGVVLYEVMLGEYPPIQVNIDAKDPQHKYVVDDELMQCKLTDSPTDLAKLCKSLLNPKPKNRPCGIDVLRALGAPNTVEAQSSHLVQTVGRDAELHKLQIGLKQLDNAVSSLIVVRGVSGQGKTALLQQWIRQTESANLLFFSLRCFHQDHTPLRLLNMLVQSLVHSLSELPEDVWRGAIDETAKLIGQTFPQIQQLVPGTPYRTLGELDPTNSAARRDASLSALISLLATLSHLRPIAIIVDDVHWADADSLRTLCQLLTADQQKFRGMIVLADLANHAGFVNQVLAENPVPARQQIDLEPLKKEDCQVLLRKWAAEAGTRLSPAIQVDLTQRSSGNPFLLLELFRAYQQAAKNVAFTEERWLCNDSPETSIRRFSLLPIQAENVLQYLAVADQPIGIHQLQMVSRVAPHELQQTLSYLGAQGWIRNRGENLESEVEISNESFRKLVVESLPLDRLHRRHFRMARVLSGETPPPWSRIAHHYWNANKIREAAACYMEAARVAAGASAFDGALYFLGRAFQKEADRSPQEQFNALKLKANCLAGMGSSIDAAKLFEELRSQTSDPREQTLIECLAGEQWIRAGQLDNGLNALRVALGELGFVHGKKTRWKILRLRLRSLIAGIKGQAKRQGTHNLHSFSLLEQSLTRVSTPLTFLDNQLGPELILRLDEIAQKRGSVFDQAQVLVRSGVVLSFAGRRWRKSALLRLKLGRSLARGTRVASAQATGYFCMFVWNIHRGSYRKALTYANKALHLYERGKESAQWEIQFLHWGILACYWNANRLLELQRSTLMLRASAENRADSMSLYWMNVNAAIWADLSEHKVEQAKQALEIADKAIANHSFQSPRFYLWHSRILLAAYDQDWVTAQRLLADDWDELAKSWILRSNHSLWLALSARICVDLISHRAEARSKHAHSSHWLDDARRSASELIRLEERIFVYLGTAFSLVIEAAAGQVAEPRSWEACVNNLHSAGHHLMALALQWHQSLYAGPEVADRFQANTERIMRQAGCAQPQRLLNILLPLP